MKSDAVQTIIEELLPFQLLLRLNIPEAQVLSGLPIKTKRILSQRQS
jgi:hydroxymethylpyrimidine/phosphomethylpyrimidine kinase